MFEYQEVKKTLEEKRRQILHRVELIEKDRTRVDGPLTRDLEDQSTDIENYTVLDALNATEKKEIEEIESAIKKLEMGTYGICTDCGGKISEKRLRALPYATTCITCSEQNSAEARRA